MYIYTGSMENDYLEMLKMEMIIYCEVRCGWGMDSGCAFVTLRYGQLHTEALSLSPACSHFIL